MNQITSNTMMYDSNMNKKVRQYKSLIAATMYMIFVAINTTVSAHESQPKDFIGYVKLPSIQTPLWHELIENGGTKYPYVYGRINLYKSPQKTENSTLIIEDYSRIVSHKLEYEGHDWALIYEKKSNWVQVKTFEGQFLWINNDDTGEYVSYADALRNRSIYLYERSRILHSRPNTDSSVIVLSKELEKEAWFSVRDVKETNGEIWVLVGHEWTECVHGGTNITPKDARFKFEGWMNARDKKGEPPFGMFIIC